MRISRRLFSHLLILSALFSILILGIPLSPARAAMPGFDVTKMSDMSDFDPTNPAIPTGDTLKIGLVQVFSGPGAGNGEIYWLVLNWLAHDINKRGGVRVDGKMKKIQIIKGDHQEKPAVAKKVTEKLLLEDKVHVIWGTSGSHIALVMQQVAAEYKVIYQNPLALAEDLMNGKNFNRYTFRTMLNTTMFGNAVGYYFSQRPEKKFYILNQDYLFGHQLADAFKNGLKKYKPSAEIVGEAYHPLFHKDFAPYLTKIQGTPTEVIFTGDWLPDSGNLLKQARDMGIKLPFANLFMDEPNSLAGVGPEGTVGLIHVNQFLVDDDTPAKKAWLMNWNSQWKKWKAPYNTQLYKWPGGTIGATLSQTYWLIDVISRAGSTDPEKIIKVWEGDEWNSIVGPLKMRACDHQAIMDHYATEYVFPNKWFDKAASNGKVVTIPAQYVAPPVPADLDRCKK